MSVPSLSVPADRDPEEGAHRSKCATRVFKSSTSACNVPRTFSESSRGEGWVTVTPVCPTSDGSGTGSDHPSSLARFPKVFGSNHSPRELICPLHLHATNKSSSPFSKKRN